MRVTVFHNMIAPYRHDLFAQLSKYAQSRVYYYTDKTKDRFWSVARPNSYWSAVLPNFNVYLLGRPFTFSFGLTSALFGSRPDYTVTTLTRANALSILLIIMLRNVLGYKVVLWVGERDTRFSADERLVRLPRVVSQLSRRFYAYCARRASGAICYSPATVAWVRRLSESLPVIVGGQVCDPPAIPPRLVVDESIPRRVIFAASATARKGYKDALTAFARVKTVLGGEIEFHFVGDREFPELGNFALEQSAIVHPYLGRDEFFELLRSMDVLVLPSVHDPWGNVVHEAMLVGTPAIVSTGCGAAGLVEDMGLAFEPGDVDRLVEILLSCLGSKQKREDLRGAAVARTCDQGHGRFARALVDYLQGLA